MTLADGPIAVVGTGLMGQGIAVALARGGRNVTVSDVPGRLDAVMAAIGERMTRAAEAEGANAAAGRVRAAGSLAEAVAGAHLVIEAVPEIMDVKLEVLRAIDEAAEPSTVIASNTSALPLDELAAALREGRQLIAMHFFNPAEIVPGVEIAALREDQQPLLDEAFELLTAIGKKPVRVKPVAGFIGNRLQLALFCEAARCVEEGLASPAEIDEVVRTTFGFRLPRYGPFQIGDMAGLAVFSSILTTLHGHFGKRFDEPAILRDLVAAGHLGIATGSGFYDYSDDDRASFLIDRDRRYRAVLAADSDAR